MLIKNIQNLTNLVQVINETKLTEDGATSCGSAMQGGGLNPDAGQYTKPLGKIQRRKIYITNEQYDMLKEIYEIYDGCKDGEEGATALIILDKYRDALRAYPNNATLLSERSGELLKVDLILFRRHIVLTGNVTEFEYCKKKFDEINSLNKSINCPNGRL